MTEDMTPSIFANSSDRITRSSLVQLRGFFQVVHLAPASTLRFPTVERFPSPVDLLAQRLGCEWKNMTGARARTAEARAKLEGLASLSAEDTSIIFYGSIGRAEVTESSDADWCVIVDGPSDPGHASLVADVGDRLASLGFKPPGRTETFAGLVSSHELVHHIGGTHDTNQNLTHRMLLLFESVAITQPLVRERVIRNVLDRYVTHDVIAPRAETPRDIVPHFLLNDVVRYWRTMASDYPAKMWERRREGWGLRNVKLRFSRKLIFVAGLLACFSFEWDPPADAGDIRADRESLLPRLRDHIRSHLNQTPLELLARAALASSDHSTSRRLFDAYDQFLGILADPAKWSDLERLAIENTLDSRVWKEAHDASGVFRDAIQTMFLVNDGRLKDLTMRFGVF
jgi:hypothetical protein